MGNTATTLCLHRLSLEASSRGEATGGSVLITIVAHATEGIIEPSEFWAAGAAAAQGGLIYDVLWCAVALGLVVFDWRFWRGLAPAPATVQPMYEDESRVR